MSTFSNFESQLKKHNINQIQVCYVDYSGRLCGKLIPISEMKSVILKGVVFAKANLSFGLDDHFAEDAIFLANTGDFLANPDFNSFTFLKHRPGIGRYFSNMIDESGNNWNGCPRNQLQIILNKYEDLDLKVKISLEPEFSIFKNNENDFEPLSFDGMFTMSGMDKIHSIWQRLYESFESNNINIEQVGKEYGPGQYEATWKYDDVIKSIDNYLNFKDFVKTIVREHGYHATFMPKPYDHLPGNGLHIHLSLWDRNNKEISCSDDDEFPLSEIGSYFVAGLLKYSHSLTAIGCASINSYKRILPGSWSPAHICWGSENRSALVRIPGQGNRRHIELRHGDNMNNPYIYLNAILASGLDGIQNKLTLEKPITEDAGQLSDINNKSSIKVLPRSLNDALSFLKKNKVFRSHLGEIIFDEFIKIKETELRQFETSVHLWERQRYIDVF